MIYKELSTRRTAKTLFLLLAIFFSFGLFSTIYATPKEVTNVFNVHNYGAAGDGKNLDSPAINKAIGAAVKVGGVRQLCLSTFRDW
jgi:hypothetical protein